MRLRPNLKDICVTFSEVLLLKPSNLHGRQEKMVDNREPRDEYSLRDVQISLLRRDI